MVYFVYTYFKVKEYQEYQLIDKLYAIIKHFASTTLNLI